MMLLCCAAGNNIARAFLFRHSVISWSNRTPLIVDSHCISSYFCVHSNLETKYQAPHVISFRDLEVWSSPGNWEPCNIVKDIHPELSAAMSGKRESMTYIIL